MRAFTYHEAVMLALEDADRCARKRKKLRKFYAKADRISHADGWKPWWDRPPVCPAGHVNPDWHIARDSRGWSVRRCRECERERARTRLGEGE